MITLNLAAMNADEIIMKDYLENNVSEELARKINNGVQIEKDGKTLINKKTLENFINHFASGKAQKLLQPGARSVGIYRDAIFSWLIEYFEDDSVEGKLYNLDGTEYKPTVKTVTKSTAPSKPVVPAKPKPMDLFDMMAAQNQETKLAEFEADELEVAKIDEDENEADVPEDDEKPIKAGVNRFAVPDNDDVEESEPDALSEAAKAPVSDVKPVSKVQEQLREHIAAQYKHPANNIIVCGMPPATVAKQSASELKYADKNGVLYTTPTADTVPVFLINTFCSALKIEVD